MVFFSKCLLKKNTFYSFDNFRIANLAMIRLKQQGLRNIKTMHIYSPNQLDFTGISINQIFI
jgi:hypothetical protein